MSVSPRPDAVARQYASAANLNLRASLHEKYSVNPQGFMPWLFGQYIIRPGDSLLEVGCGNGSLWKGRLDRLPEGCRLLLTDLSAGMLDAARENLGAPGNVEYAQADIQSLFPPDGCFDAVTANPPYTGGSKGLTNSTDAKMIARHEVACTLEDFFTAAAGLLKSKGHFFMIHRPARLVDIFSLGRKHGLEPKEIRMIRPDKKSSPSMVLVHMIRNGGAELKVREGLFIRDESGDYSREIEEIYERGKYQK